MVTDCITLSDLHVDAVIHALDPDASRRTRLTVNLELHLDLEAAGRTDDFAHSVDFFQVTDIVETFAQHGRWWMLESMALAMARTLLLSPAPGEARAALESVTMRLTRPTLLGGRAVPGLVLERARRWCTTERRVLGPGVAADVIAETRQTDVLRVRLTPGARWQLPVDAHALPLTQLSVTEREIAADDFSGAVLVFVRK